MNTKDKVLLTFPESLPLNFDTIHRFAADFLSGKLASKEQKRLFEDMALTAPNIARRNQAQRQELRKSPEVKRGVSEAFDAEYDIKGYIAVATPENFNELVMEEGRDVVLMLHSHACEPCAYFAVYFKRVAERLSELRVQSLRIVRMDVGLHVPPANLLGEGQLPQVIILPAYNKREPYAYFSGVGKPQEMMKWVHQHADITFELAHLPHLTEEQRLLYKQQIRDREEHLEAKAQGELEDMEKEEQRQQKLRQTLNERLERETNGKLNDSENMMDVIGSAVERIEL
jgi:hypothetical protein